VTTVASETAIASSLVLPTSDAHDTIAPKDMMAVVTMLK
jgi:hypothetical protein